MNECIKNIYRWVATKGRITIDDKYDESYRVKGRSSRGPLLGWLSPHTPISPTQVSKGLGLDDPNLHLHKVYNGLSIETDQGIFGIAQRDDGIEVLLNGQLVWSSMSLIEIMNKSVAGLYYWILISNVVMRTKANTQDNTFRIYAEDLSGRPVLVGLLGPNE